MNCLLVLSLAVLGASASPCGLNFNSGSQVCGSALQGKTLYAQTQVVENPTSIFPPYVPPTSVSQSCHCLKTVVRPQIRSEVITVPHIDRIVRVIPSPVVEAVTVDLGGNTRNAPVSGINTGVSGEVVEGVTGVVSGSYPRVVEGVTGVVSYPRIVEGVTGVVSNSYPRIVEGVVGGSSFQGFGGVIASGNSGCGCGSNIVV